MQGIEQVTAGLLNITAWLLSTMNLPMWRSNNQHASAPPIQHPGTFLQRTPHHSRSRGGDPLVSSIIAPSRPILFAAPPTNSCAPSMQPAPSADPLKWWTVSILRQLCCCQQPPPALLLCTSASSAIVSCLRQPCCCQQPPPALLSCQLPPPVLLLSVASTSSAIISFLCQLCYCQLPPPALLLSAASATFATVSYHHHQFC